MAFDREVWEGLRAMRPTEAPRLRVSMYTWQQPPTGIEAPDEVPVDHLAGDVRVLKDVPSAHLEHARDVWVYLPPGYEQSSETYPVLYMHDGNNLFDPEAAFDGQGWGVNETAEWLIQAGKLPPMIIVGTANSPARLDEYTWEACPNEGGGKGADYARFMVEELKPLIDTHYRTRREREHTAVLGSSLGGLISLYLGLHHGDTFGRVGAMSPSLWWADRRALRDLEGMRQDVKIWLDMGSAEGQDEAESQAYLQDARDLRDLLLARGFEMERNLAHWEQSGAEHAESDWAERVAMVMQFLVDAEVTALPEAA